MAAPRRRRRLGPRRSAAGFVLGVGEQAAAQDGGKAAGSGGRECWRGARSHRVQLLHYGLDLLSYRFGFVPAGVAAGCRGGDYQRGAFAVGDGFGNSDSGQCVAQPVAGAAYVIDLLDGGDPARRFVDQYQRGPVANEFLESGSAGVADTVIEFRKSASRAHRKRLPRPGDKPGIR